MADKAEALKKNLNSNYAYELIPFIEGYGFSGQIEKSRDLSIFGLKLNPNLKPLLCITWDRIGNNSDSVKNNPEELLRIYRELGCKSD